MVSHKRLPRSGGFAYPGKCYLGIRPKCYADNAEVPVLDDEVVHADARKAEINANPKSATPVFANSKIELKAPLASTLHR